jgi:exonuclease VII large subunit
MSDVVSRLRKDARWNERYNRQGDAGFLNEAADRIEELEAALAGAREERDRANKRFLDFRRLYDALGANLAEAHAISDSLRETKNTFFANAEAWERRAEAAEAALATAREALEVFANWHLTHPDATLPRGLSHADFALTVAVLARIGGKK